MSRYRKSDVQKHADNWARGGNPAVNVKVYKSVTDEVMRQAYADVIGDDQGAACNLAWAETVLGPDDTWLFQNACERGFEDARELAAEIFPVPVQVYSEGRQGGWLVVFGLPDVEEWDAIALNRWARFEKACRALADDVPYQMACSLILNEWEQATEVANRSKEMASA